MVDTDMVFQVGFGGKIKKSKYVSDHQLIGAEKYNDIIIHVDLNSVNMQLTFYCTSVATMWTFVRFFSSMNSNVSFEVRIGFK